MKKLDIEDLKREYIGKTVNWLTIIDVVRDDRRKIKFVCKCVCGTVKYIAKDLIVNNKAFSCGCYRSSKEWAIKNRRWRDDQDKVAAVAAKHSQWYKDHPEEAKHIGESISKWRKDNPDKVAERSLKSSKTQSLSRKPQKQVRVKLSREEQSERHRKWWDEHREEQSEKLKRVWANHPEKTAERGKKVSQWYKDNPEKAAERGKKVSQWYKDNPSLARDKFDRLSQFCRDNPDFIKERSQKFSQWCKDNPDKVAAKTAKYREWAISNPAKIAEIAEKNRQWRASNKDKCDHIGQQISEWYTNNPDLSYKHSTNVSNSLLKFNVNKRSSCDFSELLAIIHPKYIDDLVSGIITSDDYIETKCPICGNYDKHTLGSVFSLSDQAVHSARLCNICISSKSTSHYEDDIENCISKFYAGECIRNTRSIISPLELDLYYPEKKIAVEFNGDYWHNEDHKPHDYHFNKFKLCANLGIVLVSIFESSWNSDRDSIIEYLSDLFSNKDNRLSIVHNNYMNNNYPLPSFSFNDDNDFIEDYYVDTSNKRIYTCGYTTI